MVLSVNANYEVKTQKISEIIIITMNNISHQLKGQRRSQEVPLMFKILSKD